MNNCIVLVILLIIIIIFTVGVFGTCSVIVIKKSSRNRFEDRFEDSSGYKPAESIQDRWKRRYSILESVDPILYRRHFSGYPSPSLKGNPKPGTILVSIASYRDNQCIDTVKNIIKSSDNPEKLSIVICQQNSPLDKDCLGWCSSKDTGCNQAKIERLSYLEAKGPTYARWRIQQKWDGEEYFMQIDAHTRMVDHWDTILKEQLALCGSDKPILTQYPLEYDIVPDGERNDPVREKWRLDRNRGSMYVQKFDDGDGLYRIQSDYTSELRSSPFVSKCWAAGFSFSKSDFIRDVPYDPYTPFLFFGEEMDIAARAYTHGYDFFSPSLPVVFHNYERKHRNTFWERFEQKPLEILSRFRIYYRLGYIGSVPERYSFILNDIEKYPIGKVRTLEEWERYCGMSLKDEKLI